MLEKAETLIAKQDFAGAKKVLRSILLRNRVNRGALYLLGIAEAELGNVEVALDLFSRVIAIDPRHAEAQYTKASLLVRLKKHLLALEHHDQAVTLLASSPWPFINRGISRAALKDFEGAIDDFDEAIRLDPILSAAFLNKGNALLEMKQPELSLEHLQKALELNSHDAQTHASMSACLIKLRRPGEAYVFAEKAIDINPGLAGAHLNRGKALNELKRHQEALACCERAMELEPLNAEAWSTCGFTLGELERHDQAIASYQRAIELKPDGDFWLGDLVFYQMRVCAWADLDQQRASLQAGVKAGDKVSTPFAVLGLFDRPELQKLSAEIYIKDELCLRGHLGVIGQRPRRDKIRIGYFSMDYREHPVSHLVAELLEIHDRSKFEIYGFSFGVNTKDSMRERLEKAFDRFFDVSNLSDIDIARLSRQHEIDIAIDLGGHTQDSRPQIFAERAAPIQINYLGYPGTWGADCMDYFIGDRVTVTDENREHFTEKVIYLPNSFQANPSHRPVADNRLSRQAYGLPEKSFVFCCFNNTWKISPEIFHRWLRLLHRVPNSVLWLYSDSPLSAGNMLKEAEKHGIPSERLIFARRVPWDEYLAQFQHADIFLDTLPYNAGTTASDALWAGLPVLTQAGKSFAGRMAASLLYALGAPELVTRTAEEYDSLAIEFALNPEKLAPIQMKLKQNRLNTPLFNTRLFARHIESAYQAAYHRHHAGLLPDDIHEQA